MPLANLRQQLTGLQPGMATTTAAGQSVEGLGRGLQPLLLQVIE